jgi:LmbE family N-acetylglucosaminyl deacetylase
MADRLKLLCVLAHPDDETLGCGGLIAWSVAHDIDVYLICATRGERGWAGRAEDDPGLAVLGRIREAELREAARVLGIHEVILLDYTDGDLDRAAPAEAIGQIAYHVRRLQPQVVVTFDCFGAYGHPDHIAISQFTHAALVCAADQSYRDPGDQPPYRVAKLYWQVDAQNFADQLMPIFGGTISMPVDGETRRWTPFPEWSITTRLDARAHWQTVRRAVQCHRTQLPTLPDLDELSDEQHQMFWGQPTLYRVYSFVNGGRGVERDLFAGLR